MTLKGIIMNKDTVNIFCTVSVMLWTCCLNHIIRKGQITFFYAVVVVRCLLGDGFTGCLNSREGKQVVERSNQNTLFLPFVSVCPLEVGRRCWVIRWTKWVSLHSAREGQRWGFLCRVAGERSSFYCLSGASGPLCSRWVSRICSVLCGWSLMLCLLAVLETEVLLAIKGMKFWPQKRHTYTHTCTHRQTSQGKMIRILHAVIMTPWSQWHVN